MIISIIALVLAINSSSKIKELERENKNCKKAIGEILDVIDENPEFKKQIYENQTLMQHQKHIVAQNTIEQEIQTPHQTPTVQKMPVQQTATPILASSQPRAFTPIPNAKQQKQTQTQTSIQTPKIPKENTNFENVFGKNVIGIVATILIFIGVIAFGTLMFTSFTDTIKVISMFIASFATVGVGLFFTKKNKTTFSEILTGCGMGMIYISLFISHLYFGIINDITTFVLIFLWSIGVSFVSKKFNIKSLSYIALGGCIISSIFSLIYGFASQKFVEITIYHILTFILLIISNKENKILFKLSSLSSIVLNTILSGVILSYVENNNGYHSDINTLLPVENVGYGLLALCFILAIYNIAIHIYSSRKDLFGDVSDIIFSNVIHYVSIVVTFCLPISTILNDVIFINSETSALFALCFLGLTFLVVIASQTVYCFANKEPTKRVLSFILAEVFLSIMMWLSPISIGNDSIMSFLLFPIINLFLFKKLEDKDIKLANLVYWSGFGILAFDAMISLFYLVYFQIFGVNYSLVLIGIVTMYIVSKYKDVFAFPFVQTLLLNTHLLFTTLNFAEKFEIPFTFILLPIVICNIAVSGYYNFIKNDENKVSVVLTEIMESLLIFILSIVVIFTKEDAPVSSFLLSSALIPLALIRIRSVIESKNGFMSVWYGLKFTFYVFMTTETFMHLSDQQFILSLFFMVLASVCIIFGFRKELKPLRIYGLALIMTSVFKMVVIDVWDQNSLIRVASLIVGGIICFAISAAYSKFEKKQMELSDTEEMLYVKKDE